MATLYLANSYVVFFLVGSKSEDDYFEAPSKRPYASGVASLASHLYGSSLSQNKPPEGQHKLIIDLFVALFRFKPNRSIRWNMGKCVRETQIHSRSILVTLINVLFLFL